MAFAVCLIAPCAVLAQSLFDTKATIVKKTRRHTSHRFRPSITLGEMSRAAGAQVPKGISEDTEIAVSAHVFRGTESAAFSEYDGLPDCEEKQIRMEEVFSGDRALKGINLIAYRFDSAEQKGHGARHSMAFPYIPGDLSNPYRERGNNTQEFLRLLGFRCLPTAVEHVEEKRRTFLRYREGALAWEAKKEDTNP